MGMVGQMRLLVTGGAGFIGSHFVRYMLRSKDVTRIVNLDKLTYAGHLENLEGLEKDPRYTFIKGDIADATLVEKLCPDVDAIVNFAAETHVDRSIHDAAPFLRTNVIGTQVLLEAARKAKTARFLHISTDEVYGSISQGAASETSILNPSSPYAASKASSDLMVLAYHKTFGSPVLITRAANNYGPFQYPEKFLPLFITHALTDQPLPLYGDGMNTRDWLHVEDHCAGIDLVLRKGRIGEIYNIGTGVDSANLDVVKRLLKHLNKPESLITFVPDRPGHDRRYAMNIKKMASELNWRTKINFDEGFDDLIRWYENHRAWWEPLTSGSSEYKKYFARQYGQRLTKTKK
jgi:dTDP-glucose 4,6-dehydratase